MVRQLIKTIVGTIIIISAATNVSAQTTESLSQSLGCKPIHTVNELGKQVKVGSYCIDSSESQSENTKSSKFNECQGKSQNIKYYIDENLLPQIPIDQESESTKKDGLTLDFPDRCRQILLKLKTKNIGN